MRTRSISRLSIVYCAIVIGLSGMAALAASPDDRAEKPVSVKLAGPADRSFSATGTLEPVEVVDVSWQGDAHIVSRIVGFGTDRNGKTIDYNSKVSKGDVLAKIDDTTIAAQVNEAKAREQLAEAKMAVSEAALKQATANLQRVQQLAKSAAITTSEVDAAATAEQTAKGGINIAAAQIAVQKAALAKAELELDRTTIRSPISGVIIDRRVNIGQTVISRVDTPSLFLIAADLKKLEIWASVNENNIARVHVGEPVQFTVEAVPGKTFDGRVRQVRLNAQMTQNVVTYTVVISFDNPDEKLLPYMTANVRFSEKPAAD